MTQDVVIIGAGPAGTTAATVLAQHGHRVLVLEKEKFPRYHIGESLIPFCYYPLKRIGFIEKMKASHFVKKLSVQFIGKSGKASLPFYFHDHMDHDSSTTWQVDRATFDLMMLNHAREHGVNVLEETKVLELIEENGAVVGVVAQSKGEEPQEFRAPITIDCSGLQGFSMNKQRWRVPEPNLRKTAIWSYFKGAKRDEGRDEGATTVAYIYDKGWFWYLPLANDMVSVGVVAEKEYLFKETKDLASIFYREVENNVWIKDHLACGTQAQDFQATSDYSYRSKYSARDGLVLAGDAFSFIDPVFSSGVFLALVSGELVGDAVHQCLQEKNYGAAMFDEYAKKYRHGIEVMRKFVYAFYDVNFNFKTITKDHPHLAADLTDCLIGNVYKDLDELFDKIGEVSDVPEALSHGLPKTEVKA